MYFWKISRLKVRVLFFSSGCFVYVLSVTERLFSEEFHAIVYGSYTDQAPPDSTQRNLFPFLSEYTATVNDFQLGFHRQLSTSRWRGFRQTMFTITLFLNSPKTTLESLSKYNTWKSIL